MFQVHPCQPCSHLLLFSAFYIALTCESMDKTPLCMLYKVVLNVESGEEISKCSHSTESD